MPLRLSEGLFHRVFSASEVQGKSEVSLHMQNYISGPKARRVVCAEVYQFMSGAFMYHANAE